MGWQNLAIGHQLPYDDINWHIPQAILMPKIGDHHKDPNRNHKEKSHKNNVTQCI